MADKTGIEWTDATWNPIRGCTPVSEGCANCYAAKVAGRFSGPGMPYEGLVRGDKWTGKIKFAADHIADPLKWKEPRRIFVNSMSDLFHPGVGDDLIAAIFGVMMAAPQHTFQILTKRPENMESWFRWIEKEGGIGSYIRDHANNLRGFFDSVIRTENYRGIKHRASSDPWGQIFNAASFRPEGPLPNVWLGVSVENQKAADERIPLLMETPAEVRFLSCEPLLGPLDLTRKLGVGRYCPDCQDEVSVDMDGLCIHCGEDAVFYGVDWVIAGGESGPSARPMHPDWVRSLRDQCQAAGVPFFFKQWGEFHPGAPSGAPKLYLDIKGRSVTEFRPENLPRDAKSCDGWEAMYRVGKKAAGRFLDGRTWDEFPSAEVNAAI